MCAWQSQSCVSPTRVHGIVVETISIGMVVYSYLGLANWGPGSSIGRAQNFCERNSEVMGSNPIRGSCLFVRVGFSFGQFPRGEHLVCLSMRMVNVFCMCSSLQRTWGRMHVYVE